MLQFDRDDRRHDRLPQTERPCFQAAFAQADRTGFAVLGQVLFFLEAASLAALSLLISELISARSNGVTIKDLNGLKTNTRVTAQVSSGTGQPGIDYWTTQVESVYRRTTTPLRTGFYQILYLNTAFAFALSEHESKSSYIHPRISMRPGTHRRYFYASSGEIMRPGRRTHA